jgi:hypothetical protein
VSGKEALIEWIHQLPDDYGLRDLLVALQERYDREHPSPGPPPENDYEWPAPDLTEDEWRQFVAHSLRQELEDPREDIYTPEDGESADEPG